MFLFIQKYLCRLKMTTPSAIGEGLSATTERTTNSELPSTMTYGSTTEGLTTQGLTTEELTFGEAMTRTALENPEQPSTLGIEVRRVLANIQSIFGVTLPLPTPTSAPTPALTVRDRDIDNADSIFRRNELSTIGLRGPEDIHPIEASLRFQRDTIVEVDRRQRHAMNNDSFHVILNDETDKPKDLFLHKSKLEAFKALFATIDSNNETCCQICNEAVGELNCGKQECAGSMCPRCFHACFLMNTKCPFCRQEYIPLTQRTPTQP